MSHFHSLAAHTGTRLDSAAKHNMACKVDTALVKAWMSDGDLSNADQRLHVEKMRYCVHKDELVLSTNQKVHSSSKFSAYPLIVSNVIDIPSVVKARMFLLYAQPTFQSWSDYLTALKRENNGTAALPGPHTDHLSTILQKTDGMDAARADAKVAEDLGYNEKRMLHEMPVFVAKGYALGVGYASHFSGDTVCTVQIGGMITVMNGAFTCHTGDLVQWYFTGEEHLFYRENTANNLEGERIDLANLARAQPHNMPRRDERRMDFNDHRMFGMQKDSDQHKRRAVFRPKPYRRFRTNAEVPNMEDHFGDKIRVFAKCIGGAKPYEMMDIMLLTQSL